MIGKKLKALRKENGYTQKDLAIKLDVTRQAISLWEKDLRDPDLPTLIKIAKLFDITTDELLDVESKYIEEFTYNDGVHQIKHKRK